MVDVVFVHPGGKREIYQRLEEFSAIEPPFIAASISSFLRNRGYKVAIIDAHAENLSPEEVKEKAVTLNPELVVILVYGNNPSASTPVMTPAGQIAKELKSAKLTVAIGGLHPTVFPERTLTEESVDFVIMGEEQIPIVELLEFLKGKRRLKDVRGICFKDGESIVRNTKPDLIQDLDEYLPIASWDLLPVDKYRAHNWHCFENLKDRSYGAIYTSLGCPFSCKFCCINALYGKPMIRYRSPEIVVKEIEVLRVEFGIRNIKIIDEMFMLNEKHYMAIVDGLIEKKLDVNIWAYARIDTVKPEVLRKLREAGFHWLCLGVESASERVGKEVGIAFEHKKIFDVIEKIRNAGIYVLANYMFGLWEDDYQTMLETLSLALRLNTEFANFYPVIPYPGSRLYELAISKGFKLPKRWSHYSPYSPYLIPMPTKYLSPLEVLKFRDYAWKTYFSNPAYLKMIENTFGHEVAAHVLRMVEINLERDYDYVREVIES